MTILNAISIEHGKKVIREIVENIDDESTEVLVLPQFIGGWQSQIVNMESEAAKRLKFVVYKDANADQYDVQAIPLSGSSPQSEVRAAFPMKWRGASEWRLSKTTGIETALYCHKAGHLAIATTKEDAIALAELALDWEKRADSEENDEKKEETPIKMDEQEGKPVQIINKLDNCLE